MESLVSRLDDMDRDELKRMLKTLQTLLEKTHDRITALKEQPAISPPPPVDPALFQLRDPAN